MNCGEGVQYRTRSFRHPQKARLNYCHQLVKTWEERKCYGNNDEGFPDSSCRSNNDGDDDDDGDYDDSTPSNRNLYRTRSLQYYSAPSNNPVCEISAWSDWSACSKSCGEGQMLRTRHYNNPIEEDDCQVII